MQKQTNQIRIRKPILILMVSIIMLAIATPVLADYLGPDRVTTESHVETFDVGVWAKDADGSCTPTHSPPACIVCRWEGDPGSACGDAEYSYKTGSQSEVVTTRIVLPPATINGTLQNCTLQNGWCVTAPELFLNSNEPLSGYSIITIEGTLNGEVFACTDTSCNVPLNEGNNDFTYWAISSWGDSSTMGRFTQKVDTVSPNVGMDVIGSNGKNGWYVSQTTVTATGSDSTSGLYETLLSVDNGAWQQSAVLNDGVYDIAVRAIDNAGNISNSSATISVDTTTPSLNVALNGTPGKNGWYVSKAKVSAMASDATSGIASLEFSADGDAYRNYNSPISFSDGHHTYQFRAADIAGNVTESPLQEVFVDITFPAISLTEELSLGDTFYYDIQDSGSELATVRVVIEDEKERFPKVTWQEPLSGEKFKDEIVWDGKFKDGVQAPAGTYYVTIKATDSAGNESIKAGAVKVELFSFLQSIPKFTPPTSQADSEVTPSASQDPSITSLNIGFGGTTTQSTGTTSQSLLLSAGISSSSPSTSSSSNVLWGGVALAVIGTATAYALEEKRKRKEAEAEQLRQAEEKAEKLNAAEAARKSQEWQDGQNTLNKLIETALVQGASKEEIADIKTKAATQGLGVAIGSAENLNQSLQQEGFKAYYEARKQGEAEAAQKAEDAEKLAELQAGLGAYYAGRKAGEVEAANKALTRTEASWWSSAWNWAFKNQVELSLGTGIVVGLAAVVLVVAGIITAPAWLVVGGAVLVTAVLVTAGTLALNTHFGLNLGNNLAKNISVGAVAAFLTTGAGLLLANFAPLIGTTIATTCTNYATACSQIGTIVDKGEEALLSGQLAYYNWVGDQDNAAQTMIELQLELMDGDAPGNSVALEIGDQIAKLGPEAAEQVAKYGHDIIPLLIAYGDDAVDIIGAYGDEGIALLFKYGDDTRKVVDLVIEFGTPAVKLLDVVDPISASKLLKTLDGDVLEHAMKEGPDAVSALSRWSDKELMEFGPELALRAKKDAKVLDAIKKLINLGPIDPKHLTIEQQNLINVIAENSMQYSDEGQIVLGKWVDYANGFTSVARETGSVHYNPHPDMWNLLGQLGDGHRDEAAWLVNKQVIQIGIDKDLPFEYTLNGLPLDKIEFEEYAIEKIWEGGSSRELIYSNIKESLGVDTVPIRLKELVELYSAGYTYSFDNITNSYILIKP